jgi:Fe-S cluster assembly iron-binding protein IscA
MLMVTEDAATVIRELIELSPNPADAGLRIASHTDEAYGEPTLELAISDRPGDDDVIVTVDDDARIYLDPVVAPDFETKVLHAEADQGRVRFLVAEQRGTDKPSQNGSGSVS